MRGLRFHTAGEPGVQHHRTTSRTTPQHTYAQRGPKLKTAQPGRAAQCAHVTALCLAGLKCAAHSDVP